MISRRRFLGRASVALAAAALTLAAAPDARADGLSGIDAVFTATAVIGATLLVTGTVFTIHDAWAVSKDQVPALGWSITETILMTPQAVLFNGFMGALHGSGERNGIMSVALVIPTAWTGAMSAHGILSLAAPTTDRGTVYGLSWALGANLAFTTGAVAALFDEEHTPPAAFGVAEMLGTAPSFLVGAANLLDSDMRDQGSWTALTAWSGALFVHGAATVVAAVTRDRRKDRHDATMDAPMPRDLFAKRLHFAPTVVSDGVVRAPGIGVSGVF